MYTIGWILVALIVAALVRNLITAVNLPPPLVRNAPVIAAITAVNIMSALDAISTIYLVDHGYSDEMNPAMDALLGHSYVLFFLVKMSITLVATMVCWHYYGRRRRARMVLKLTSHIYSLLLAWHCLLLSSVLL
ncbi:MAG TPA: DUF5658 family protein [Blastocatellia bacterium]|nr:DUF5658 family protein [Blastocatellia bacterium]